MANYLCIFSAPDPHIMFLAANPEALWNYVDGQRPEPPTPKRPGLFDKLFGRSSGPAPTTEIPNDWPPKEARMIGPEINHRNVYLYHRILNGGEEFVSGAGTIFQTWLTPRNHGAITIGGNGETFAFTSEIIPSLQQLVSRVDPVRVNQQYSSWLKKKGQKHVPRTDECEEFAKEFTELSQELQAVVAAGNGIVWISS
jgi:hypothetical protein